MKIPVFVSCPTALSPEQEASRRIILDELDRYGFEERRLGFSDYPTELPLREVLVLAKHCAGGIIIGFEQLQVSAGAWKRGTHKERSVGSALAIPSPWNNLEAGILFALQIPLLIFKENGIEGGVFDHGVTDAFVHPIPLPGISDSDKKAVQSVFMKWQARVRDYYYR
jgi:hypothetical protein